RRPERGGTHGNADGIGASRARARVAGHGHALLSHGRPHARDRERLHQAGRARHRHAPRASGVDDGARLQPPDAAARRLHGLLGRAERPLIVGGSGAWWSDAASAFQAFVEATGIPFYTTPISRGTVPEDHELAFLNARAKAFGEADALLAVGTRFNYVLQFGR